MPEPTIENLVRPSIRALTPYSSARDEFTGRAEVYLDANENPYDTGLNRYPDPLARTVKEAIGRVKGVSPEQLVLGNGSDEIIDLALRIFCQPGRDEVMTLPPTYGMYRVAADINEVGVREVPLTNRFQPDVEAVLAAVGPNTKLLWLCTPNNPSGNDFGEEKVAALLDGFPGIVVIDEAYIDFAGRPSYTQWLTQYPRLIVMQTFSKAWGMAGIRLGMAFASPDIIDYFNKVKPPYNINQLTQRTVLDALRTEEEVVQERVRTLIAQRVLLQQHLSGLEFVRHIYPSDANFLLVKVDQPRELYDYLLAQGIIVRDRSRQPGCDGCLRITVGTPEENEVLWRALVEFNG